jgi:methionine salvage enolase-phosphatase E1
LTFQIVLGQAGRRADNCLFIDDSRQNVQTASNVGIQSVHFTSTAELLQMLKEHGIAINGAATIEGYPATDLRSSKNSKKAKCGSPQTGLSQDNNLKGAQAK